MHEPAYPSGTDSQRLMDQFREAALVSGTVPAAVRPPVRDSWSRSLRSGVAAGMARAPLVLDEAGLDRVRAGTDWLPAARRALGMQHDLAADGGHVLTLFDAAGRMLVSEGAPHSLDLLGEIGFHPGALWSEQAVGTNGPGTALATGRAAHIVGAEHFCDAWQPWHCAAAPVRDPLTGEIVGVIDISGPRKAAHPHTLTLAVAIALAIEQMLEAREAARRARVVGRLAELSGRWPGDTVIAVDRSGALIGTSSAAGAALHGLADDPQRLRRQLAAAAAAQAGESGELHLPDGASAILLPVLDGGVPIGACMVLSRTPAGGRGVAARLTGAPSAPRPQARRADGNVARYTLEDLVGQAPPLVEVCRVALAAASNTLPVLIQGESGTGKELFAQGIHRASDRAAGPFVAVNCAALPRELIESELFGYVGGAFSGARREGRAGKYEVADGGTLFLDEVTELPPAAQAALLRALQEGEVTRVGAATTRRVDVRVIAATNRQLDQCVAAGVMREDLFYRLSVLPLELPPLRQRGGDIGLLAEHFRSEACRELARPGCDFGPGVLEALRAYRWPGNVRELKNLMRRLVALASGPTITCDDLPMPVREARFEVAEGAGRDALSRERPSAQAAGDRDAAAREELRRVVEESPSMQHAAARLGVTRSTLYRRLERYGLRPGRTLRS
jgi:sigma-54 dependent transcriptional regulator, acetoin dehydrogenase operon transcriptional activator AcoR